MLLWTLTFCLIFVAPWAAVAKIVSSFTECEGLFYSSIEPQGFSMQNVKKICQKYHNRYRFATLYSTEYNVPVYNAFRLYYPSSVNYGNEWFPDLEDSDEESTCPESDKQKNVNMKQDISSDHKDNRQQTQHPCSNVGTIPFHLYTLIVTIPVNELFKKKWYSETQKHIQRFMDSCAEASLFLVTGVFPSYHEARSNGASESRLVWIAGYCSTLDGHDSVFAYIGKADGNIKEVVLLELQDVLGEGVVIFKNSCQNKKVKHFASSLISDMGTLLRAAVNVLQQGLILLFVSELMYIVIARRKVVSVTRIFATVEKVIKKKTETEEKCIFLLFVSFRFFISSSLMVFQNDIVVTLCDWLSFGALSLAIHLLMAFNFHGKCHYWSITTTVMVIVPSNLVPSFVIGYILSCLPILLCIFGGTGGILFITFLDDSRKSKVYIFALSCAFFFLSTAVTKLLVYAILAIWCPSRVILTDHVSFATIIAEKTGVAAVAIVSLQVVFSLVALIFSLAAFIVCNSITAFLWLISSFFIEDVLKDLRNMVRC